MQISTTPNPNPVDDAPLADILATLRSRPGERANVDRIEDYRSRYGAAA